MAQRKVTNQVKKVEANEKKATTKKTTVAKKAPAKKPAAKEEDPEGSTELEVVEKVSLLTKVKNGAQAVVDKIPEPVKKTGRTIRNGLAIVGTVVAVKAIVDHFGDDEYDEAALADTIAARDTLLSICKDSDAWCEERLLRIASALDEKLLYCLVLLS